MFSAIYDKCLGRKINWLQVYKKISCSTQNEHEISTAHKTKMLKNKDFFPLKHSNGLFILLINVEMPTIVGISTFVTRINFKLS